MQEKTVIPYHRKRCSKSYTTFNNAAFQSFHCQSWARAGRHMSVEVICGLPGPANWREGNADVRENAPGRNDAKKKESYYTSRQFHACTNIVASVSAGVPIPAKCSQSHFNSEREVATCFDRQRNRTTAQSSIHTIEFRVSNSRGELLFSTSR